MLRDCMYSVGVADPKRPGQFLFDFTPQAEEELERWAGAGMRAVESNPADGRVGVSQALVLFVAGSRA